MLSASSPLFSATVWPLDQVVHQDPILNDQNYFYFDQTETSESYFQFPPSSQPPVDADWCKTSSGGTGHDDSTMAKKLNHNASERDRRKKINHLYSSLRSLLPMEDQLKKLSYPATISRVLSYIPELQKEVEGLMRKKEELFLGMAGQEDIIHEQKQLRKAAWTSLCAVSSNRLNEREVMVQISTDNLHQNRLSEVLSVLEEDGLFLLNASSFESHNGRVFFNLHLQVESSYGLEPKTMNEKLLLFHENTKEFLG